MADPRWRTTDAVETWRISPITTHVRRSADAPPRDDTRPDRGKLLSARSLDVFQRSWAYKRHPIPFSLFLQRDIRANFEEE